MIKYVEYLETNGSQAGWILDGSMTASTDVLYFDFMPLSGSVNYDAFWVFLDKDSCYEIRCNVYNRTTIIFSKGNTTNYFNITYGERYNVVFGSAVTINGNVLIENPSNPINSNPMCVNCWNQAFYGEVNNIYRAQRARYYGVKLTDSNGNVLREWKPCINDDNNSVGFYETVTQTYVAQTGSGTTSIGPYLSTIFVDSDIKAVPASGGTINVTISTDTPWSATSTGSWYTMSQTEGTENDTAITITVPSTTSATQSEDTITFTNENGDTDQLTIKQRKYSAGGIRLLNIGDTEIEDLYVKTFINVFDYNSSFDDATNTYHLTYATTGVHASGFYSLGYVINGTESVSGHITIYWNNGVLGYDTTNWSGGNVNGTVSNNNTIELTISDATSNVFFEVDLIEYMAEVETIYMGEEIVYQKGNGSGISMRSKAKVGTKSGSTNNLKITSSEPWTLSVDTAVTWLNFSQLTGDTGETIVTITATEDNQTVDNRATTITATTANYSATCEVTQIAVILVDYIHEQTLKNNPSATDDIIDTNIIATTATTYRVKALGKGYYNGNLNVGYFISDLTDYRLFFPPNEGNSLMFDYGNTRINISNWGGLYDGRFVDLTCRNYSVSSGNSQTPMITGRTQTTMPQQDTIKIDVGSWWVKSLEIWDGETKVFDGHAAVLNGTIGLYDSITESMFTNSAITLTTEDINMDLFSAIVPQTQEYIIDGGTTYYKYDKSLGYYETQSNEKVIGHLTKKYDGGKICVLKDVDNNFSYRLIVNGNNVEIYSQGGSLLTSLASGSSTTINGMKISNYLGTSDNQIYFETTNAMWEIRQIA